MHDAHSLAVPAHNSDLLGNIATFATSCLFFPSPLIPDPLMAKVSEREEKEEKEGLKFLQAAEGKETSVTKEKKRKRRREKIFFGHEFGK